MVHPSIPLEEIVCSLHRSCRLVRRQIPLRRCRLGSVRIFAKGASVVQSIYTVFRFPFSWMGTELGDTSVSLNGSNLGDKMFYTIKWPIALHYMLSVAGD